VQVSVNIALLGVGVNKACCACWAIFVQVSGSVDQSGAMISEDVAEKGYALLCVAQPKEDCKIITITEVSRVSLRQACISCSCTDYVCVSQPKKDCKIITITEVSRVSLRQVCISCSCTDDVCVCACVCHSPARTVRSPLSGDKARQLQERQKTSCQGTGKTRQKTSCQGTRKDC